MILKPTNNSVIPIKYKARNGERMVENIMNERNRITGHMLYDDARLPVVAKNQLTQNKVSYKGFSLQRQNGVYWSLRDNETNTIFPLEPEKVYSFVTMLDSTIRIDINSEDGHLLLSDYAPLVKYAGKITFNAEQEINSWNNDSTDYRPPAFLARQAGFGNESMDKFYNVEPTPDEAITSTIAPSISL